MTDNLQHLTSMPKKNKKGYVSSTTIRSICFYVLVFCILAGVSMCVLAIWDFANEDVLWRSLATISVIAGGTLAFAFLNGLFADCN